MNILKELTTAETNPKDWTKEDSVGMAAIGVMALFVFAVVYAALKVFL